MQSLSYLSAMSNGAQGHAIGSEGGLDPATAGLSAVGMIVPHGDGGDYGSTTASRQRRSQREVTPSSSSVPSTASLRGARSAMNGSESRSGHGSATGASAGAGSVGRSRARSYSSGGSSPGSQSRGSMEGQTSRGVGIRSGSAILGSDGVDRGRLHTSRGSGRFS